MSPAKSVPLAAKAEEYIWPEKLGTGVIWIWSIEAPAWKVKINAEEKRIKTVNITSKFFLKILFTSFRRYAK